MVDKNTELSFFYPKKIICIFFVDQLLRSSRHEDKKDFSTDLENLTQQLSTKTDLKPIIDAIQILQTSFDKEKLKPDVLARKLDLIDQKLKEIHPEHMNLIKDIQTKINPLPKTASQTNEILTKLNDRIKMIQADTNKSYPTMINKLDDINSYIRDQQQNLLIESIEQFLNEKLNPFMEQQIKKEDEEYRLGKQLN